MKEKIGFKELSIWLKIPIVYFWANIGIFGIVVLIAIFSWVTGNVS